MATAYINGNIFTGAKIRRGEAILVADGIIQDLVTPGQVPSHYQTEDLQGLNIAPALIDLQIYGGNGKMFSQALSIEALQSTYEYCLSGGAGHFMITLATNTLEKFLKGMEIVDAYWDQGGKGLLGLHLEGPYINPVKRGAHLPGCIKTPTREEVALLAEKGAGVLKMMTLAPEQCGPEIIDLLLKRSVLISAGHSNAGYREATDAFNKGIPAATHLYNAMSPLHHRAPGMVGAIFEHPSVMSSIVCDGIHVDYAAVRIAKRLMKERLFFITDAVAETTTGEYQHLFKGDHYALADGTLSGSALTMMQCVRNGVREAGIPLEEALRMASTYPARLLAGRKLGRIEKGYEASLLVFDEALAVRKLVTE